MDSAIKLLFFSAILIVAIRLTNAAATASVVGSSPDDPNKCFRSEDKLTLAVGEVKHLPDCSVISCQKLRSRLRIETMSCGLMAPAEGCRMFADSSKQYPGCCPQQVCD